MLRRRIRRSPAPGTAATRLDGRAVSTAWSHWWQRRLPAGLAASLLAGCSDPNQGVSPPSGEFAFPMALSLDPRTPPGEPSRYLMIGNGNNDLFYNGGTVMAVDLERFFSLWSDGGLGIYPYCEDAGRCVLDQGSRTDASHPCRRLSLKQHVVECDERAVVASTVRVGDFVADMKTSRGGSGPRLWATIRGDPSVTYIDVGGDPSQAPRLECGQADQVCSDAFRLTHLRNDPDLERFGREPYGLYVSETEHYRYAYVTHADGPRLSLIDLDGVGGRPALVDVNELFSTLDGFGSGGFGVAERPCSTEAAPGVTNGCTRPLVYSSYRSQRLLASFSASGLEDDELPPGARQRTSCMDGQGNFVGAFCGRPEDLGEPCALICEPRVHTERRFFPGGLDPIQGSAEPVLGDIAFGDAEGRDLYVLQTNPGALIHVDTDIDIDGEPRNLPARPPVEICAQPSRMVTWENWAFVTCFGAAEVFVVDLQAFRVVDNEVIGTGAHSLLIDPERQLLYVANALENSISILDLRARSRNQFREIARIGLQEPFSQ